MVGVASYLPCGVLFFFFLNASSCAVTELESERLGCIGEDKIRSDAVRIAIRIRVDTCFSRSTHLKCGKTSGVLASLGRGRTDFILCTQLIRSFDIGFQYR